MQRAGIRDLVGHILKPNCPKDFDYTHFKGKLLVCNLYYLVLQFLNSKRYCDLKTLTSKSCRWNEVADWWMYVENLLVSLKIVLQNVQGHMMK